MSDLWRGAGVGGGGNWDEVVILINRLRRARGIWFLVWDNHVLAYAVAKARLRPIGLLQSKEIQDRQV